MLLNSPSLTHDGEIPSKYTCDGDDILPPFKIFYPPHDALSLVFVVEDHDAPAGIWTHLMVWNIDPSIKEIEEGKVPMGVVGKNSGMTEGWYSICPPEGEHRYFFKIFALDTKLDLDPETATRDDLLLAMEEHILAKEELMGRYTKVENKVTLEQPV
ncbi:YbhB/YbcL family Raf kinase inhibitor-like protein [Candidatus Dojkabacteria bacterium]|nr:YbhB/YbcL family Raf kinase inhibitor-like protein [Candidatus Dojkabacteria bacterium]